MLSKFKEDNLDKTRSRILIDSMKRNTESNFYLHLCEYLKLREHEVQELLCKTDDVHDIFRLQGRVTELNEFLKALERKPVVNQYDGAFNQ
jgi:hypothetical protein